MRKKILLAVFSVLVGIQFVRPAKNISTEPTPNDIFVAHSASSNVRHTIERACYDCHSNTTHYPWYADVQPLGWWLASHVKDGKHHLNFSEFASYTPKRAKKKLTESVEELREGEMPLKAYTAVHPAARLSNEDRENLIGWFEHIEAGIPAEVAAK